MNTNKSILPVYFISHGGGPWVWMPEMKPVYRKNDYRNYRGDGTIGSPRF